MADRELEATLADHNPWWSDPLARRATAWPFRRRLHARLASRLRDVTDRRATVLLGPRQVGKSVLLLQLADELLAAGLPPQNVLYFDFADERLREPVGARQIADLIPPGTASDQPRVLLLDEITRAPRWDAWLKQAVDGRLAKILATDSAASLLRSGSVESGLGRWDEIRIEPLAFEEFLALLGPQDEEGQPRPLPPTLPLVTRYLRFGGFPEHARDDDLRRAHERLRADAVERAILRDLASASLDIDQVRRLFVYLMHTSGATFEASGRAQELGVDRRSVAAWWERLRDTALLVELPRFATRAAARQRGTAKIFGCDPGLVAAFAPALGEEGLGGRLYEAAVFRHLRELREVELAYFRHRDDVELDFLVETGDGRVGIEVTSSRSPDARKLARARAAVQSAGAARLIVVHGGARDEDADGARLVPLPRFLLETESIVGSGVSG